jgi:ribosomal protein S18 acetylase RimI-like enzyme
MKSEADGIAYTIRVFQYPPDYPAVIALWESAGPGVHVRRSDSASEIEKKLQRDPDLFLVAEHDGRIIGTVMAGFDGRRGMIYHLAVVPEYRQLGLGTALMDEVERRLKEKGCIRSYLMVTRDNPSALDFYSRRGWETMDLNVMAKDL